MRNNIKQLKITYAKNSKENYKHCISFLKIWRPILIGQI